MIQQVTILGDSWSCHSWSKGSNFKELAGNVTFQQLFESININCVNRSKKAGSNKDVIDILTNNLDSINSSDLIIVFQTDPLRDVLNNQAVDFELSVELPVVKQLDELAENLCLEFYTSLERLIKKPVVLVGGLSALCFQHIPKTFDYLNKSWTEIVDNQFTDCYYEWVDPTLYVYNQLQLPYTGFLDIEKKILAKNHTWQTSSSFSWCHPGDHAYMLMFQALENKLKEYR